MELGIGDGYRQVMVLSTAYQRHAGAQRLPDRFSPTGDRIAAVQVDGEFAARQVCAELDQAERCLFIDDERKIEADLLAIAHETVRLATVTPVKANDKTVDALEAVVDSHVSMATRGRRAIVVGTGNLAFKIALRLVERGMDVGLGGRSAERRHAIAQGINAILPRYTTSSVSGELVDDAGLLVSAISASGLVDEPYLEFLGPRALCVDVGIDNLASSFITAALRRGHTCIRLDTRATPIHPQASAEFFSKVTGERHIDGVRVVAGGIIGHRGDVVVDQINGSNRVVGLANGSGGLVPSIDWSATEQAAVSAVQRAITAGGG